VLLKALSIKKADLEVNRLTGMWRQCTAMLSKQTPSWLQQHLSTRQSRRLLQKIHCLS